jgi:hypothetical protein
MGAGGDLGHDAAELGMQVRLPDHDRRQDLRRLARSAQHRAAVSSQLDSSPRMRRSWLKDGSDTLSGGAGR